MGGGHFEHCVHRVPSPSTRDRHPCSSLAFWWMQCVKTIFSLSWGLYSGLWRWGTRKMTLMCSSCKWGLCKIAREAHAPRRTMLLQAVRDSHLRLVNCNSSTTMLKRGKIYKLMKILTRWKQMFSKLKCPASTCIPFTSFSIIPLPAP